MSLIWPLHGVYIVFHTVSGGSFEGFWRVREARRARGCGPKARQAPRRVRVVRAVIRRKSMAAICHGPGRFSTLPARASPVAISPRLPDRHIRLYLRRRVAPHRAARPAAQEPRQRHPEARPPAKARNAFCPVLTTGWRMLTPRAKGPENLARPMLVDPEERISRLSAEALILLLHHSARSVATRPKQIASRRSPVCRVCGLHILWLRSRGLFHLPSSISIGTGPTYLCRPETWRPAHVSGFHPEPDEQRS